MKILKAGTDAGDAQTTYNFIDLRQRCDDYVNRVRQQCRGWVTDAQSEAEAIRQSAYDEGRKQGLRDGLSDAAAQIAKQAEARSDAAIAQAVGTAVPALEAAAREIGLQRDAWLQRWERDAVGLALAVAERLTRARIDIDAEVLRSRVAETVQLAAGETTVTVRLHPDDIAAIAKLSEPAADVTFEPDATLKPGDCIATTGEGRVDGRLQTQLNAIERELFE